MINVLEKACKSKKEKF